MGLVLFSIVALHVLRTSDAFVNNKLGLACRSLRLQEHNGVGLQSLQSQPFGLGLLRDIDVVSADYYSRNLAMDSVDDIEWVRKPGLLWAAATKDAQARNMMAKDYLDNMRAALANFSMSTKVNGRQEIYEFLETVYMSDGRLLLVLGGKSVGKSLVLADFEKKLREKGNIFPLLVDDQTFSGALLATGILEAYYKIPWVAIEETAFKVSDVFPQVQPTEKSPLVTELFNQMRGLKKPNEDKTKTFEAFNQAIDEFERTKPSAPEALMSFVQLAAFLKRKPVLIIDEAHKVLGLGAGQDSSSSTLDLIGS